MSTCITDGKQIFNVVSNLLILIKFSEWYIANMIGAACNSRIPQANMHAVLNFVHAKKCCQYIIHIQKFC